MLTNDGPGAATLETSRRPHDVLGDNALLV